MNNNLLLYNEDYIINKKDVLKQLIEHAKYLYEEEIKRADRFHNAVKTYLVFILPTFPVTLGAIKFINSNPTGFFNLNLPVRDLVIGGILGVSLLMTVVSFIFSISVIKTWKTERLCKPKEFYAKALNFTDEKYILQEILIDFLVATEKNADVNNKKGRLLSLSAKMYHISILFLVFGGILYVYT